MAYFLLVPSTNHGNESQPVMMIIPSDMVVTPIVQPQTNSVAGFLINQTVAQNVTVSSEVQPEYVPEQPLITKSSSGSGAAVPYSKIQPKGDLIPPPGLIPVRVEPIFDGRQARKKKLKFDVKVELDPVKYKKFLDDSRNLLLQNRISIGTYVSRLIIHDLQGKFVRCEFCGSNIPAVCRSKRSTHRVVDHARRHLGIFNITCHLCDYKSVTRSGALHHYKRVHGLSSSAAKLDERIVNFGGLEQLVPVIDRCFGDGGQKATTDKDLTINEYFGRAIAGRVENGNVRCLVCQCQVQVRSYQRHGHLRAIDHVLMHLHKELYSCRLCTDYHGHTRVAVGRHLRAVHNQQPAGNYVDTTGDCVDEIKAGIDLCFGRPKELGKSPFTLPDQILQQLEHSKQKIVNRRCGELIKLYSKSNRLTCLLCSKSVVVISALHAVITRFALDHAFDHVGKPLFQCRYCPKTTTGMQPILMHVRNTHGESSVNGYTSISHEHNQEILRMVNKCYDKEWKTDGLERYGLEESDDECEQDEDSQKEKPETRYNLRPRLQKRPPEGAVADDVSSGKRKKRKSAARFKTLKLPLDTQASARVRFLYDDGSSYGCPRCSMVSKHEALVKSHMKVAHSIFR